MFFCCNDAAAKSSVATLLTDLGGEPVDVGGVAQALHLEHMTLLWIRMVRVGCASPHTVWARLPTPAWRAAARAVRRSPLRGTCMALGLSESRTKYRLERSLVALCL